MDVDRIFAAISAAQAELSAADEALLRAETESEQYLTAESVRRAGKAAERVRRASAKLRALRYDLDAAAAAAE